MEDSKATSRKSVYQPIVNITLHQYVFDFLSESNKKLYRPLGDIYLYYCAQLFEKYLHSDLFFNSSELGTQFLEIITTSTENQYGNSNNFDSTTCTASKLQTVAEKAFLNCAMFAKSKKIQFIGINYYSQLSKHSFLKLNNFRPAYMENKNFFLNYASHTSLLISLLSSINQQQENQSFWDLFSPKIHE